ncbi:YihY/virulence factor BrkB family protein [Actinotalea sp. BY-33]|uniref:YihY/virulence factor BrkB family protein n=1 Tax=Actinotalea soli TaxID=2819234 RepID=A0A939LPY2_9CELL|nr:YihY/virulence factor BrkB family protein [Actinotalea soli]MBO1751814.1 YihY/virulence factor BrkB family protein [Actinotalea soli]
MKLRAGPRGSGVLDRLEALAVRHPVTVRRDNLALVAVRGVRRSIEVRVTGLAAEMTYYAIISLLPLLTALGAALGFLERVLGDEQVTEIEDGLVDGLARVFDQQVTTDVLAPLVRSLLREERTGVAVTSIVVALWLASRMFRAAIRALDDAYRVPERRGLLGQWGLGLGMSLGAVVTLVSLLGMLVVGPLLGGGQRLAEWFGWGDVFTGVWAVLRWPAIGLVCIAFLTLLYRWGPNVVTTWRRCLPGAVVGMLGLVGVAVAFQVYLDVAGPGAPDVGQADAAVRVAAQVIGAALAGILWLWLSAIVILVGGVVNAELQAQRDEPALPAT